MLVMMVEVQDRESSWLCVCGGGLGLCLRCGASAGVWKKAEVLLAALGQEHKDDGRTCGCVGGWMKAHENGYTRPEEEQSSVYEGRHRPRSSGERA